jgi:hypothetical protein
LTIIGGLATHRVRRLAARQRADHAEAGRDQHAGLDAGPWSSASRCLSGMGA